MYLFAVILSLYVSVTSQWLSLLEIGAAPLSYLLGLNVLGLRPVTIFFELVEPFSLVLLVLGHTLSIVLGKNTLINDLVNIATGDILGSRIQKITRRGLSFLLPSSSFAKLLSLYKSYYGMLNHFRR